MVFLENLSSNLTQKIQQNVKDIDDTKQEVINYGIYLFLSDTIKTIIVLSVAYYLNILFYIILSIFFAGLLRTFSGGVHAKSWLGCLLTNFIINFSVVYLSIFLLNSTSILTNFLIFTISLLIIYFYAPSDHENKPVVSKKQRKSLRKASFTIIILEYGLAIFFMPSIISNIIIISTFIVTIAMLPLTYTLTGNKHGSLENF